MRNRISTPKTNFSFSQVNLEQVIKTFEKISMYSSPGYSGIPTTILLNSLKELAPILVKIFNHCIITGTIPSEWKFSIVCHFLKTKVKSMIVTTIEEFRFSLP